MLVFKGEGDSLEEVVNEAETELVIETDGERLNEAETESELVIETDGE